VRERPNLDTSQPSVLSFAGQLAKGYRCPNGIRRNWNGRYGFEERNGRDWNTDLLQGVERLGYNLRFILREKAEL
jgi:hypothetical protein